ncbi:NHLP family bacteriocin export ABC transporter permease/ATPase subunit [Streptomyces thermoviolaceus subsp. thermoviolaceus]|uniref:NHLP bacteriocin export ABC transporter permease/ATPase subunit n=1 Tax=Streptomyces thermoviolaceus subsp. thermoviolaceus TaxID=66860 RepID=A0ABX0YLY5_STRTL|nr:NHLP bacteriocin export ABC transporter permease/ATPase subunit [Streptomyces thermoviolaceus]NJP13542.1 NHLP bacteriocin export ABC transporter permease/ATPase subunit [Streptomyces thermoviolaceus subsp. thermoviolaceus]WTD46298.1 NHLP bacteriocin export ABC transporter permease/ATPase subunit [Streptomyces thermoviolaceus]GHA76075.1 NHLP family bacteriocin export ABC transporter permease/ATPase subunit [Streptomyces thermoviolaceus subsp. thermoviolaceus]
MTTVEDGDLVLGALASVGTPVDCAGLNRLDLEGPQVLWLVAAGAVDLFAVDAAEQGHWHHLGRLQAGSLLLGPVSGPRHTLVARPLRDSVVHRIGLRELYQPATTQTWSYDEWGNPQYVPPASSPLEHALALGVGRSMSVLFQAPTAQDRTTPPGDDDVFWMQVPPGSVQYGALYGADTAGDLLMDPGVWQGMVDQQYRLLTALDRWIEELERAHETRAAAGVKAGEAVRAEADRTLLASIGRSSGRRITAADADATYAACVRVARAAGITLADPPQTGTVSDRLDPVERIALASRVRTRAVRLRGRWWRENAGPLVGRRALSGAPVALLWRRGGYIAVHPATGRETPVGKGNAGEFEDRAVMFYRPLPDRPLSRLGLLRFSLRGSTSDLVNLLIAGLVTVVVGALVPVATGKVLGQYVQRAQTGPITQVCVAVMAGGVVAAAFMLLQNLTVLRVEGRIEAALQPAVWDRLLRLPTAFFARRSTGELASAAMGISAIRRLLAGLAPTVAQSVTVGVVNLVLLFWYSASMALAALGMLTVIAAVFLALGLWQVRWQRRLVVLTNKLNNQAFQTLRGLPKLRVAAAENYAYAAWAEQFARSRELQQKVGRIKNLTAVLGAVYLPVCTLVMFMLLAGPARGTMSAAAFLTFNTSVTMLLTSVTQLTGAFVSAVAALPLFEQIRPVLDARPEVRTGSTLPGPLSGAIEARRLSFRYTDDGPLVLDDVSFQVKPGEFVAIVGPSGCGKSTLLRLLIGFDRPLSGSVLYDGQDLAALDQSAVRRQCGVVLQHAQPLNGSILDVIRGTEPCSPEEAMAAAEMAGLAEDIRRMPMGLHTIVSGGSSISGGQRQRLMIAQALVRRPRILFLDEATSALDNDTQRTVIDSTRKLNATRIVIAHRLSTVLDADRVIVMEEGRITEQGTPAELLADTGGRLHELVRRQMA